MGISMIYNDYTTSASTYNNITYLSYSNSGPGDKSRYNA